LTVILVIRRRVPVGRAIGLIGFALVVGLTFNILRIVAIVMATMQSDMNYDAIHEGLGTLIYLLALVVVYAGNAAVGGGAKEASRELRPPEKDRTMEGGALRRRLLLTSARHSIRPDKANLPVSSRGPLAPDYGVHIPISRDIPLLSVTADPNNRAATVVSVPLLARHASSCSARKASTP